MNSRMVTPFIRDEKLAHSEGASFNFKILRTTASDKKTLLFPPSLSRSLLDGFGHGYNRNTRFEDGAHRIDVVGA